MVQTHHIRRQVLQLRVPDQDRAARLQARAMQALRAIGPRLQPVLDRHGPTDGSLRIPRLELDLGCLSEAELENGLLELLPQRLAQALEDLSSVAGTADPMTARSGPWSSQASFPYPRTGKDAQAYPGRAQSRQLQGREGTLEALRCYLLSGRLPWWIRQLPEDAAELCLQALETTGWRDELLKALRAGQDQVPARLIQLLGFERLRQWTLDRLPAAEHSLLPSLFEQLSCSQVEQVRLYLGLALLLPTPLPAEQARQILLPERSWLLPGTRPLPPMFDAETGVATARSDADPGSLRCVLREMLEAAGSDADSLAPGPPESSEADAGDQSYELLDDKQEQAQRQALDKAILQQINPSYIQGAGVILVHPFLLSLFQEFGLLQGLEFTDSQARQRAVRLLEYLVWGKTGRPEYELVLEKHLCAMPPEQHLEPVELQPDECAEADRLLAALIGHWDALKSTSPDGLREGFLQREGRLDLENEEPVLRVSPAPQDVLLSRLPWTIGMVKLPWMPAILRVEWG